MSTLCSQCWFIKEPKHWNGQNIWKTLPKKALYELKYFHFHVTSAAAWPRKSTPWSSQSAVFVLMFWSSSGSLYWIAKITAVYWTVYNIILKPFHEQVSPFSSFSTPQWDHFLAHICYITIKNMLYSLLLLQTYTMSHLNMAYELQLWPRVLAVAQSTSCTLPL